MSMDDLKQMKQRLRKVIADNRDAAEKVMKRANKNRPREVTSKWREKPQFSTPKIVRRDPRFDDKSGDFNEKTFREDYKFLDEIREKEVSLVGRAFKTEKDPAKKEKLKKLKQKLENQDLSWKKKREEQRLEKKVREVVKETTGQTFVNKSHVRDFKLVEQFKQLKKSGKLSKYIEKKRKKNVDKDRRKTPFS